MIDLSKVTCPILEILRRCTDIPKTEPNKKEVISSTLRVSLPDLSSVYKEPKPTRGQEIIKNVRGF